MPTKYFVTRHDGAILWAYRAKHRATKTPQLDVSIIEAGDVVIGTLPVHLASEVVKRGGKYWHLAMEVPAAFRGKELSADQMKQFGARLEEYRVLFRGEKTSPDLAITIPSFASESRLVHVVIASQQIVPNLLPALSSSCVGMEMLVSAEPTIRESAVLLKSILEDHFHEQKGFSVAEHDLGKAVQYPALVRKFSLARDAILKKWGGTALFVNITGGTKLMALAAAEVFAGHGYVAYCDTAANHIECTDPPDCKPVPLNYDAFPFDLYLAANRYAIVKPVGAGYSETTAVEMTHRQRLTGFLARNASTMGTTLVPRGRLERSVDGRSWPEEMKEDGQGTQRSETNVLARLSEIGSNVDRNKRDQRRKVHLHVRWTLPSGPGYKTWCQLLKKFQSAGLIKIVKQGSPRGVDADANDSSIHFKFYHWGSARYMGGSWLEEFATLTGRYVAAKAKLDPNAVVHMGVELTPKLSSKKVDTKDRAMNEVDTAIYHQGRLLIIEAKVGSIMDKSQPILNKLERLKRSAGGPFGAAWLLAVRPVSGSDLSTRASFYGIEVHGPEKLESLHTAVAEWLGVPWDDESKSPIWSNDVWEPTLQ